MAVLAILGGGGGGNTRNAGSDTFSTPLAVHSAPYGNRYGMDASHSSASALGNIALRGHKTGRGGEDEELLGSFRAVKLTLSLSLA